MKKRFSIVIPNSKVANLEDINMKNIKENIINDNIDNIESDSLQSFNMFAILKQKKRNSLSIINPLDELTNNIIKDLKLVQTNDYKEDLIFSNTLVEKASINNINGKKIKLVDLIFHIMKKNQKNGNELLILKLYFLKMDRLVSLLLPLKINISDMLSKLVCQMKCEKILKDNILFKAGDIGEKLYIVLKGTVSILIKKEINIECTQLEFLKYLIILYLYQEDNLISEIITKNHGIINIDENILLTLLLIFKFFYFFKQNSKLIKNYKTVFDFISGESKLRAFIHRKYNYTPMLSLEILNYGKNTIQQLYDFYSRKIKEISKSIRNYMIGKNLNENSKRQIRASVASSSSTQEELQIFLKIYDESKKKSKNQEDLYKKISGLNEIPTNKIFSCSTEKYIQRLDVGNILLLIQEDTKNNNYDDNVIIFEEKINLITYVYYEINHLDEGNIFGELALSDPLSKRSATVITKNNCYFASINKEIYDLSLKVAQEKMRLRNVLFFTRGPIFKGLSTNIFLNNFFYRFKKNFYKKGDILFRKGEKRKEIIFVVIGELELSGNITLSEITGIINTLGGILDDNYSRYLCNTYYQFKDYYYNYKHNFKLCVLKDKEIIGLEDITSNSINIFNCICVSTEKTEVYQLDYNIFEEAKRYKKIRSNIVDFVNLKRNFFIKILMEQRNTLISKELTKIRKEQNRKNILKNNPISILNNNFLPISKNVKFSYNKNLLSNINKNKLGKVDSLIKNIKSKSIQKSERTKYETFSLSARELDNDKNNSLSKNQIKKIDIFNKNNKYNFKLISSFKSIKTKEFTVKKKIKNNISLKKSFLNKNPIYNDNYTLSNLTNNNNIKERIYTNYNNYKKTFMPYTQRIYQARSRKKLIPFSSNSNIKKIKSEITPVIMKEFHKKFPEIRNIINIDNFYMERQDIFNSLLNIDEEEKQKYKFVSKTDRTQKKIDKEMFKIKKNVNSYDLKDKNNLENNNEKKNNFSKFNIRQKLKNPAIIDCLCLDSWKEKEQFQKKAFSEENI